MFTLIELPYAMEALAPVISAQTLSFHHGKHLQAYVDNLNKLLPGSEYEGMTLEEIVRKAPAGAVFQLPKVAEYYSFIKGKTAVIPNPINKPDVKELLSFDKRNDEIVTVGRLDLSQKRHDVLIKAFDLFLKNHPLYRLTLYGGGKEGDVNKLTALVTQLGIADKVNFAGSVSNPTERISKSKVFVLSSDFEGIPNALMEAMSIGLPCIATDCRPGGARMLIEDGENGFIVPKGDIFGLAEKMDFLATNPVLADNIGQEAMKITQRFAENKIIEMWENYLMILQ